MKQKEAGFTYPLTLCIIIIFALYFTARVGNLLNEKKMLKETESIMKQEYYMMDAVKKTEKTLQTKGLTQLSGTYQYKSGKLSFHTDPPSVNTVKITYSLLLDSGWTVNGFGYYDTSVRKMVKWIEIN